MLIINVKVKGYKINYIGTLFKKKMICFVLEILTLISNNLIKLSNFTSILSELIL